MAKTIRSLFPFSELQGSQGKVLDLVEVLLNKSNSSKFIILQSPVGSGKSAMAIAIARYFGSSHIITPRKQLQDQYFADFKDYVVLMKGRSAYPCVFSRVHSASLAQDEVRVNRIIANDITSGSVKPPSYYHREPASNAPCCRPGIKASTAAKIMDMCSTDYLCGCPYLSSLALAQTKAHVVHNPYSFLFQTSLAKKFDKRPVMIVDECHDLADIIRSYLSKDIFLYSAVEKSALPSITDLPNIDDWIEWALSTEHRPKHQAKDPDTGLTPYESHIEELQKNINVFSNQFSVSVSTDFVHGMTKITFTPIWVKHQANELLFDYADKVILMSGTIYDKIAFCRELGIPPDSAEFIDVNSTFPEDSRPIVLEKDLLVDTSHKEWSDNFPRLIENIGTILDRHFAKGENGLIHTPSYHAAAQITKVLNRNPKYYGKVLSHNSLDFVSKLEEFYSKPNAGMVFVSPVCQQGVDFKYNRARFQLICRVPYLNVDDGTTRFMLDTNNFAWYNWRTLIVFGQQCGRINRAPDDFGVTYLLDSRFFQFIKKNTRYLQQWFLKSIKVVPSQK